MTKNVHKKEVRYKSLRGALIERGYSLRSWAIKNDFPVGSVYNAVKADRHGVIAVKIRNRLVQFLNEE